MIYLATPYSHPDPAVREKRYRLACWATADFIRDGYTVFSPVVHNHPLVAHGLETAWVFWEKHDRELMACCDDVVVLTMDGWRESAGMQAEIALAEELGKRVTYIDPEEVEGSPTFAPVGAGPGG